MPRTSPNITNYFSGKGIVSFKLAGNSEYRDLGEVPSLELEPSIETLEHNSHRQGKLVRDFRAISSTAAVLNLTADEWTPQNIAMALLGEVEEGSSGEEIINILALSEIRGELKLVGTNDIGPKYEAIFPNVSFLPSGSIPFIGDELMTFELQGEVLAVAGVFGTIRDITDEPAESASA